MEINIDVKAGIGAAYQDRPCIDPLDAECPEESPNHFFICKALERFLKWNSTLPTAEQITLKKSHIPTPSPLERIKRGDTTEQFQAEKLNASLPFSLTRANKSSDSSDYYDDDDPKTTTESPGLNPNNLQVMHVNSFR